MLAGERRRRRARRPINPKKRNMGFDGPPNRWALLQKLFVLEAESNNLKNPNQFF
jgi:hypothetical protein